MVVGSDYLELTDKIFSLTGDCLTFAGIMVMVFSYVRIRGVINKYVCCFGKIGNKLVISIFPIVIALVISVILNILGLTDKLSNLIGLLGLLSSHKNFQ